MTLNVRHGGGKRDKELLQHIAAEPADVVVLTEFRHNPTGDRLAKGLAAMGLRHHSGSPHTAAGNSVFIAAREEIFPVDIVHKISPQHAQRIVCGRIGAMTVCAVYFPGEREKVTFWSADFLPAVQPLLNQQTILIGDFNTGKHLIDEIGSTFFGAEFMELLEQEGWTDAWRATHLNDRDYTWFSTAGNGFRLDHCWLSPSMKLRLIETWHVHAPRLARATDHSALIVQLE